MAIARKENQDLREKLMAKSSVQLTQFFQGLAEDQLKRVRRAIEHANTGKKQSLIKKKTALIKKLQKELAELS